MGTSEKLRRLIESMNWTRERLLTLARLEEDVYTKASLRALANALSKDNPRLTSCFPEGMAAAKKGDRV